MKIGYLFAATTGVVAIGITVLYGLLVILAESAWGPFGTPLNRFMVVGMTGIMYFVLTLFTLLMLQAATKKERWSVRSTEEAPAHIGLMYAGIGIVAWFGGTYFTTIDRTDIYGGVVILMIATGLLSIGGYVLSRAKA